MLGLSSRLSRGVTVVDLNAFSPLSYICWNLLVLGRVSHPGSTGG